MTQVLAYNLCSSYDYRAYSVPVGIQGTSIGTVGLVSCPELMTFAQLEHISQHDLKATVRLTEERLETES
jgi:hypothetical protein